MSSTLRLSLNKLPYPCTFRVWPEEENIDTFQKPSATSCHVSVQRKHVEPMHQPVSHDSSTLLLFNHSSRHAFQASAKNSVLAHFQNLIQQVFFFLFVSFVKLLGDSECFSSVNSLLVNQLNCVELKL
jgi:hypothetical protein